MAKQEPSTEVALFTDKLPATPPSFLTAAAPRGNESVSAEDMAMPRIKLMQPLSPEVNDVIQPGMFLNTITNKGVKSFLAVNLHFQKEFAVYKKRELGGGWVVSAPTEIEAHDAIQKLPGTPADYEVNESHRHVLCILDDDLKPQETVAMFLANKTGLYTSRKWNAEIQTRGNGQYDRFATVWKISSEKQTNAKGTFYAPTTEFVGWVTEELYAQAARTHDALAA